MQIKQLIEKCGKSKVIDILPSLFITIDTDKIKDSDIVCDNDYIVNPNGTTEALYIQFKNSNGTFTQLYNKNVTTQNYKKMIETMCDITPIVELFNEIEIDKASVDSVIISYLGKNSIRYKNNSEKKVGKSLYLDVHAVRIALIDMQTKQTVCRIFGNGLKICVGAFLFSFLYRYNFFTDSLRFSLFPRM